MRRTPGIVIIAAAAALWGAVPASAQVSTTVVISEFRARGPAGGNDEFVEIRNISAAPVVIGGWLLRGCASGTPGNLSTRGEPVPDGVTLQAGQTYLFANDAAGGYSGEPDPDQTYGTGFTDFGTTNFAGIVIVDAAGTRVDGVGAPNSPCREGTGITTTTVNGDVSYERVGGVQDTGNNAADFRSRTPSDPQNSEQTGPADPAPAVADSEPGNGDSNVDRNANIRVTFSEPVTANDAAFSLTCGTTTIPLTVTRESDTVYVLDPQQTLPQGASCTLRVEGDEYRDTDTDDPPDTGSDYSATFTTTGVPGLRIHDIQGRQHLSPYRGTIVAGVPGVVTATRFNGFYIQDPRPDKDIRTSEGIFIFTGSPVPAAAVVGAAVTVSGRVTEFRQGCTPTCAAPDFPAGNFGSSSFANLTLTEIDRATVTPAGSGTIKPTIVGRGGREIPDTVIDDDTPDPVRDEPPLITGNVEDKSSAPGDTANQDPTFDPWEDGIDFYESLEGMLTQINKAVVIEPTNVFSAGAANENAELAVLADGGKDASVVSDRGVIVARAFDQFPPRDYRFGDFNPERIILNDPVARDNDLAGLPEAQVGDRFDKPLTAVVDYAFGNFKFLVREVPPIVRGKLTPERAKSADKDDLSIASYNVENLDPVNDADRMPAIARQIIDNLRSPDILGLNEMQDLDGEGPLGPAGDPTFAALVAAIRAEGGPSYEYRQIDPVHNQDGGAPNANIRVGFLFNPARVQFVDRPGGTAVTATEDDPAQPGAQLTFSPGRIDPTNPAWDSSRKPLAGEFRFRGKKLFVVANHFASKGGDAPLFGRFQEPYRPSEIQRHQQAEIVNGWVERLEDAERGVRVVVLGDLNDFEFSTTVRLLERGEDSRSYELVDLWHFEPRDERYTYIFQGNGQVLDHIVVTPSLLPTVRSFDAVHINAEFDDEQLSDHDPPLVRLDLDGRGNGHGHGHDHHDDKDHGHGHDRDRDRD
jgi:endonuclease/exonuclease/phosphatase family metal-dependent hydrolase